MPGHKGKYTGTDPVRNLEPITGWFTRRPNGYFSKGGRGLIQKTGDKEYHLFHPELGGKGGLTFPTLRDAAVYRHVYLEKEPIWVRYAELYPDRVPSKSGGRFVDPSKFQLKEGKSMSAASPSKKATETEPVQRMGRRRSGARSKGGQGRKVNIRMA